MAQQSIMLEEMGWGPEGSGLGLPRSHSRDGDGDASSRFPPSSQARVGHQRHSPGRGFLSQELIT